MPTGFTWRRRTSLAKNLDKIWLWKTGEQMGKVQHDADKIR
jgi:hypothetical protein